MATKIAITNEKGGCGKTTTTVNIAAILAEHGQRVLLVDADYQSYATTYYGLYQPNALTMFFLKGLPPRWPSALPSMEWMYCGPRRH